MAFATLIAGPTASGKSALAITRALQHGARVINADSMQVYTDLAILSARPCPDDEAGVPHHLFGFVPGGQEYSVGRFLADIGPLIAVARAGGDQIVIVGGTGLYFRALTEGLVETPAVPETIRLDWEARAAAGADLRAELSRRDPVRAGQLHPADTPRLLRAITLHAATGMPYSEWLMAHPGAPLLGADEWEGVFLSPEPELLKERIDARFLAMVGMGALDEVATLMAQMPPLLANRGVMKAHGVPHLVRYLQGEMRRDEAIALSQRDTRAYARRQMIFARKYLAAPRWRWYSSIDQAASGAPISGFVS